MRLKCRYLIGIVDVNRSDLSKPLLENEIVKEIRVCSFTRNDDIDSIRSSFWIDCTMP